MNKLITKIAVGVACMGMTAGVAVSDIQVSWNGLNGFYPNPAGDGSTGLLDVAVGGQVLVQLLNAGGNGVADGSLNSAAATGDDVVLTSFILGLPGDAGADVQASSSYATFSAPTYTEPVFSAGDFFARIFSSAAPAPGDYYTDGEVAAFRDIGALDPPQPYSAQNTTVAGYSPFGFGANIVDILIVPEPATFGLLAVGMLGLMGRRRRR